MGILYAGYSRNFPAFQINQRNVIDQQQGYFMNLVKNVADQI